MAPRNRQLSSTPLEILLFLNGWYYATYFLLEIFIFVYKGLLLPYPSANLALDLIMLFLYLGIEVTRIFFGSKGNLCQRKVPLAISLALTFPAAVMAAYYLLLQTYALRLEAILNAILLLFYAVELLLGVLTLAAFSRNQWNRTGIKYSWAPQMLLDNNFHHHWPWWELDSNIWRAAGSPSLE